VQAGAREPAEAIPWDRGARLHPRGAGREPGGRRGRGAPGGAAGSRGALIPDGAPENVVRTVTENAAALKFASHGFEEE